MSNDSAYRNIEIRPPTPKEDVPAETELRRADGRSFNIDPLAWDLQVQLSVPICAENSVTV